MNRARTRASSGGGVDTGIRRSRSGGGTSRGGSGGSGGRVKNTLAGKAENTNNVFSLLWII